MSKALLRPSQSVTFVALLVVFNCLQAMLILPTACSVVSKIETDRDVRSAHYTLSQLHVRALAVPLAVSHPLCAVPRCVQSAW